MAYRTFPEACAAAEGEVIGSALEAVIDALLDAPL